MAPTRTDKLKLAVLSLALAAAIPSSALGQESLEGIWDTPVGKVRVEADGEGWLGKLLELSKACAFPKGTEVLRGRMGDGVFLGELKSCYAPKCKEREGWLLAMGQLVDGEKLSGAAAAGKCANLVYKGKPFLLVREAKGAEAAAIAAASEPEEHAPQVVPAPTPKRELDPRARKYQRAGIERMGEGRFEDARKNFQAAAEIEQGNPELLTQIGITWYARQDFERAGDYYRKALAADPSYGDAHYNLACSLVQQGRSKEALKSLKAAMDSGWLEVNTLEADHDLDALREDPAFQDLRKQMRKLADLRKATTKKNAPRGGR